MSLGYRAFWTLFANTIMIKCDQTLKIDAYAYYKCLEDMARNSGNNSADMDGQIAYHNEMEHIANRAGDYTKADHHRKMQEIYKAIKERVQLHETSDQLSHGDHEVAGTNADTKILSD